MHYIGRGMNCAQLFNQSDKREYDFSVPVATVTSNPDGQCRNSLCRRRHAASKAD